MNLGVINGQHSTWKRIKTQHVALAAAAALAGSALIGGVAIQEQSSVPGTAQQLARSGPIRLSDVVNHPGQVFVYVVNSEAEARSLEAAIASAAIEDNSGNHRNVVVVDSPEDEAELQIMQGELLSTANVGTTFIDLRR